MVKGVLAVARREVGVREVGKNQGERVEAYLASVGLGAGHPWCAAFLVWCFDQAAEDLNLDNRFIRTGYCPTIASWAEEADCLFDRPEPGDVFLRRGVTAGIRRFNHAGFVSEVNGAQFGTIEGNTNLTGSREGIGVFERERMNGNAYRFVRWRRVYSPNATYRLVMEGRELAELLVRSGRAMAPVRAVGELLGYAVEWNPRSQSVLLDGREVAGQLVLIGNKAYLPVRDFAEFLQVSMRVDDQAREITWGAPTRRSGDG